MAMSVKADNESQIEPVTFHACVGTPMLTWVAWERGEGWAPRARIPRRQPALHSRINRPPLPNKTR